MRKTLLFTMILLAVSAWAIAQQEPNAQSAPSTQGTSPSSAGQNEVQGCLGGSGNTFTVTDKTGTSYQLQLPQGADASALRPHVGEEVRVEGTASSGGSSAPGGGSSAGQRTINVKNIYRVSTTCSSKSPGTSPKGH